MTNFSRLALKKGHEAQFLNDFMMNLLKKIFWCVARIFLTQKCVTNQKSFEDTAVTNSKKLRRSRT
jgi:hypothetical protein